jgi:hypothetical protein
VTGPWDVVKTIKLDVIIFLGLIGVSVYQIAHYYPLLPHSFGSNFHIGKPGFWSDKESFFALYIVTLSLLVVIFSGFRLALSRLPVSLIGIPHRDYWLAPEKSQETLSALGTHWTWFGCATLNLTIALFQLAVEAILNQAEIPRQTVVIFVAIYLAYTLFWHLLLWIRFKKIPE